MPDTTCPACGSTDRVVPYAYGEPGAETLALFERGEVALGGCVITEDAPAFVCLACKPPRPFGRLADGQPEWFESRVCPKCSAPSVSEIDYGPTEASASVEVERPKYKCEACGHEYGAVRLMVTVHGTKEKSDGK